MYIYILKRRLLYVYIIIYNIYTNPESSEVLSIY